MNMELLNTNIVGIYTSPPRKITEKRLSYKISLPENQTYDHKNHGNIMKKWMHTILYYQNQSNEDSGWHIGGWIKASLGIALSEHPILAGRVRVPEDGGLEVVSNDSGVRCVEAEVQMSLVEFLKSKEKNNEVEGKLVYWEEIDEPDDLQFSPLFCIQVTNFKCGGYSIGISSHLLLTDTTSMVNFLNKWAEIHRSIAYEGEIHKIPLFNTQHMKLMGYSHPTKSISNTSSQNSMTMLFDIFTYEKIKSGDEMCNYFVLLCLERAESKIGNKIKSPFTLLTRESNGNVTNVVSSKQSLIGSPINMKYEFRTIISLDDLGVNGIAFLNGNGPIDASHWISCEAGEAMVIVVLLPPVEDKFGMKVYVTFSGV